MNLHYKEIIKEIRECTDDVLIELIERDLLSYFAIRQACIKKDFEQLLSKGMSRTEAVRELENIYHLSDRQIYRLLT
jgi:hypothetical protein